MVEARPTLEVCTLGETMAVMNPSSSGPLKHVDTFKKTVGGSESNVAVALSRLGHRVGWVGWFGDDEFGKEALSFIRGEGVDTSRVRLKSEARTGLYFKEKGSLGALGVYYYRDGSAASTMRFEELDLDYLLSGRLLHLTGITPLLSESCRDLTLRLASAANDRGVVLSLDANLRWLLLRDRRPWDALEPMLSRADLLFLTDEEATVLFGGADSEDFRKAKAELRDRLEGLNTELDQYLAAEYSIEPDDTQALDEWRESHQPFHWLVEFYGIMQDGGFDVVIGNPPYVQARDIEHYRVRGYKTESCGDLYAHVLERSVGISAKSMHGFIVPMSAFALEKFKPLQRLYLDRSDRLFISSWSGDANPARLFEGAKKRLQIIISQRRNGNPVQLHTSKYVKWYASERDHLFQIAPMYRQFPTAPECRFFESSLPKLSTDVETAILRKLRHCANYIAGKESANGAYNLYYTRKVSYFLQFLSFVPEVRDAQGNLREPSELKVLRFPDSLSRDLCLGALSPALFYWYFTSNSDHRNLNKRDTSVSCTLPIKRERPRNAYYIARQADEQLQGKCRTSNHILRGSR